VAHNLWGRAGRAGRKLPESGESPKGRVLSPTLAKCSVQRAS
jgi:hypothetical protein